ncbi:MAG: hypothetical protein QOF27_196 [Gaiellaceae bacterium]|jgi:hypothetical protein|nr:hypothetical protein [Gaiellaceae bacterium]
MSSLVNSVAEDPDVSPAASPSGAETVLSWRTDTLLRAGFDSYGALDLALADHVDLHAAVALVERGCSPQTALRILL